MLVPSAPSTVRVWQPTGFGGLELERLGRVPSFDQHVYHTTFELNMVLRGESRVRYRRDYWNGRVSGSEPLVFVQGVDEVSRVVATTPTLVTMRNLRLTPDLMRTPNFRSSRGC